MHGATEVTAVMNDDSMVSQWFILVLDEGQRLGDGIQNALERYGINVTILELSVGEESAYRIILNTYFVEKGTEPDHLKRQEEILRIVDALYAGRSEELDTRATTIEAAFASLADVRNS
jgi:hypothetical protein